MRISLRIRRIVFLYILDIISGPFGYRFKHMLSTSKEYPKEYLQVSGFKNGTFMAYHLDIILSIWDSNFNFLVISQRYWGCLARFASSIWKGTAVELETIPLGSAT